MDKTNNKETNMGSVNTMERRNQEEYGVYIQGSRKGRSEKRTSEPKAVAEQ